MQFKSETLLYVGKSFLRENKWNWYVQ